MKVSLITCIAFAVLASGAAAESSLQAAKKCPRGKARVTIAGKSSCKPLGNVLPRRRAGSGLAPVLQHGLEPTWGETRDGPKSLTQLVGPNTKGAVEQAIPRMLARLKTLGSGRFASTARAAAAKCKYSKTLPVSSETYKESLGGGAEMSATMRTGPDGATMSLSFTAPIPGGRAVRITVDLGLCSGERLEVDSCPTAQGVVVGSDNSEGTIKIEQLEGGDVVESQSTKIKVETKLRGQVESDAKLDSIAIDRSETYNTRIDQGRWIGVEQRMSIRRRGTIAMPSGQFSGTGSLDIQQSFHGLLSFLVNESAARERVIAEAQKSSDEAWKGFVQEVVNKYREREQNGWQKPDVCAKVEFAPRSNTLKVVRGQRGQFTGTVRAQQGGSPEGIWKVTARKRLGVRPGTARASRQAFDYRVDGDGGVSVSFRVTSKAGLATPTWEQGASKLPRRVIGSFSGRNGPNGEYSWSGTVTFVRDPSRTDVWAYYPAGGVVFTVTWIVNASEAGCSGRSESSAALGRQSGTSLVISPEPVGRRGHRYMIAMGVTAPPGRMTLTCPWGPVHLEWAAVAAFTTIPSTFYSDLKTFSGTNALPGGVSFTWDLRGSN
jgi:hypothetical protein